jgi:hypothetical protein
MRDWSCHSSGFPSGRLGLEPRSGNVGFVVDKVALKQVFSEYFGFPCQFSFHRMLQIHHHLSSGAGTIGQLVADVPSGLSHPTPKKLNYNDLPLSSSVTPGEYRDITFNKTPISSSKSLLTYQSWQLPYIIQRQITHVVEICS